MIISTLGALPFTAHAATLTDGDCGVNATYHFVASTGELQINGSGEMWDFSIFGSPFYSHTEIKAVYISANIESIGDNAFAYCTGLTALRMGAAQSLKTIGESAFYECTNLSRIVYPSTNKIDTIGASAFQNCTNLVSFQVPSDVYTIKESTFSNCSALRIVSLRSVNVIKNDAFRGCDALRDVCYGNRLVDWKDVSIGSNNSAVTNAAFHERCIGDVIGENAIYTIDWDYNMTISGTGATYDYKEADPGTPLNNLPWNFYYITVEEGITAIGSYLFYNCEYIDSIALPRSLTSIGTTAFLYCTDLDTVKYPGTQDQLKAITNGATNEYSNKQLFDATFTQVYNYQGKCGRNLRYDFDTITNTMTILGSGNMWDFIYYGKINGTTAPWANYSGTIEKLVISDGVTSIGDYAFVGSPLASLTTPSSMKRIGQYAFAYNKTFKNITVNGKNCVIDDYAFNDGDCKPDSITLNGVKSVGVDAFYEIDSNTLDLGTVEIIKNGAFSLNETVKTVKVPATCTLVDDCAFSSCSSLTDVYFYNENCVIVDEVNTVPQAATIHGYFGSTAQDYATSNNRTFVMFPCKDGKHSTVDEGKIVSTTATTYTKQYTCERCGSKFTKKYNKAANTLAVKAKTKTVKYKTVKKKTVTVKRKDVLTVSKNKGTVTYAKASGNKKITINKKTGNVTVKKGLKKGTYKVKVKVTAAGNNTYKKVTKTVTFKIKVK